MKGNITKNIGMIGCGNMGGAILRGLLQAGVLEASQLYCYDINETLQKQIRALGVSVCTDNAAVCAASDVIFLAVKPQYMAETLLALGDALDGKCVISIAAGITSDRLRDMIGGTARVLRTMPNTPAMVHAGAFALCEDSDLTKEEKDIAQTLFSSLGIVEWVPERLIDAVCGLSGSGPAYVAEFIEALADGGVREGLPRATAYRLAAQTVMGTARMVLENDTHPGVLKDMVTSPAGTTIEGCYALERGGMRAAVMDAVHAGTEKSKELGK